MNLKPILACIKSWGHKDARVTSPWEYDMDAEITVTKNVTVQVGVDYFTVGAWLDNETMQNYPMRTFHQITDLKADLAAAVALPTTYTGEH